MQDIDGENKLEQYSAYGITMSEEGNVMYHSGQRVRLFVDQLSDGSYIAANIFPFLRDRR